ncbi:MAG: FAD-dependent oxidoreductase [Kiritimatiellae bacterium]|nr:FAD-dependent oxidoreductase [Kiritimatiellia bacterium]
MICDIAILGSGPAGLTAAIYAARTGREVAVLDGLQQGGQLTQTAEVENFPGFAEPVAGIGLMNAMRAQAERCGAKFLLDEASSLEPHDGAPHTINTLTGETIEAKAIIVATGATARWTALPGEAKYRNHGISACATCDGSFFKGGDVAVIGGGDTALGDALYLARICKSVTIIHRRDAFRAAKVLADRVAAAGNIAVEWNATVAEFTGDGRRLGGILLNGGKTLAVTGAFVAIGHAPQTAFLKGAVELDAHGYVKVDGTRTSVAGIFAAGDCADPQYKQAVVAAGRGAQAAIDADRWLQETGR